MKTIAVPLSALSILCLSGALGGVARADLTWEHRLSVRLGSSETAKPIATVKLRADWQSSESDPNVAARQRLLVSALAKDFNRLPPLPFGGLGELGGGSDDPFDELLSPLLPGGSRMLPALLPEAPMISLAGRGLFEGFKSQVRRKPGAPVEAAIVTDFAGDRFLTYASPRQTSLGGPLRPTLRRVRFDPWKKLAPRLSQDAPPQLTRAQRERLGAEVRSVYRPFLKDALKLYFRPLAERRTIAGMEARGYKLAILANTGASRGGASKRAAEWAQVRIEAWMAPEQEGDQLVRSFNRQGSALRREIGGQSSSMWLNEYGPVLWQMLPQEILQMIETIVPPEGASNEFFNGTPLLVHLTVTPPPIQRMAVGEVRADLTLLSRSTTPVPARAFETPEGYKAQPLEPLLKKYDKAYNDLYAEFEKANPK